MYSPAPMTPADERMWGMFGHLSAIAASLIGLPFLGPLIVFLVYKDRNGFVRGHSAEALNMTISVIVYEIVLSIVCGLITAVTLGFGSPALGYGVRSTCRAPPATSFRTSWFLTGESSNSRKATRFESGDHQYALPFRLKISS